MQILPEAPRGAEAPSRPEPSPEPRTVPAADGRPDSDDWTLTPTPSSAWPNWTDLVRYELGPETPSDA